MQNTGHPCNQRMINHFERLRQAALTCNNLNLAKSYVSIILSLRRYPLPITSIDQAESLHGVGPASVGEFQSLLDESETSTEPPSWKRKVRERIEQMALEFGGFPAVSSDDDTSEPDNAKSKRPKPGKYSPVIGSSPWACLLVLHLYSMDHASGMPFSEIVRRMREFHTKYPKTTKFNEKIVHKLARLGLTNSAGGEVFSGPMHVSLTDLGKETSSSLWQRSLRSENLSTLLHLDTPMAAPEAPFELVMLIDCREFSVASILETIKPGIKVEQRALPIGDVVWVWRREKSDEYIAGYAVERKAVEDLSASLMDGRFEEQRRRLARAPGVSTVIYVLEGKYAEAVERVPNLLPEASLLTAMRHTELLDGFAVVTTDHATETAEALIDMHVRIQSKGTFFPSEEDSVTYRDFASNTHKSNTMTVGQMTSKMLRAVPGIGADD